MEVPSLGSAAQAAIQGLKKAQDQTQQAAENIAQGSLDPEDIVSLSLAALGVKANAAVLKSTDEQTKSLLDMLA